MLTTDPPIIPELQTLETDRLSIRMETEAAYRQKFLTASDAALKAYFGLYTDEALETQRLKVEGGLSTYRTSVVFFHLIERSLQKVVGSFAFHNWHPAHRRSEIGYAMLGEAYKNRGYMKEALPPIITFGFKAMHLNRMEAFISPDNVPSRKLVERAGFRLEGCLKQHWCKDGVIGDSLVYGLLREDYDAR